MNVYIRAWTIGRRPRYTVSDQLVSKPVGVHLIFTDPWSKGWGQPQGPRLENDLEEPDRRIIVCEESIPKAFPLTIVRCFRDFALAHFVFDDLSLLPSFQLGLTLSGENEPT